MASHQPPVAGDSGNISTDHTPGWGFRVGIVAAISFAVVLGVYFAVRIRRATRAPEVLDQPLGTRYVAGVEESGFYNAEVSATEGPFRWTNGSARLVIPFNGRPPQSLHLRLGLGVPKPIKLAIQANGTSLFNETVPPAAEWSRKFDLAGVVTRSPVTVEILSDTFFPGGSKKPGRDSRALGVCVRGVTLISKTRDLTGVNLAAEPVAEVEEGGFHNRETSFGQPCRWTDGNAWVEVPVPEDKSWTSLEVEAEIPDRPDWTVRIAINGQTLLDEKVQSGSVWSRKIPLDGVGLGRQARIEIHSPTLVPRIHDDTRTIGVRLRKLILGGG